MCGIAGFLSSSTLTRDAADILRGMTDAVRHRGPDDAGAWCDAEAGIALGHRRLSIIDLSVEGHQPMASASGRWMLVYNGEIYNFRELMAQLEARGVRFRGHSDTEVFLAAVEAWGVEGAVQRCAGMFAMALWDRESRELHLIRDRIGEKPLYYGRAGGVLLFGSELKALRAYPGFAGTIDRGALALLMRHNYVPAPFSIYEGVRKVVPGTILTFRAGRAEPAVTVYWDARAVAERGVAEPLGGSEDDVEAIFEAALRRTVREEMVSDVPLGAFLSGGVDSSTIVAMMQAESDRPVRTFTIGFHEAEYNEADHARAVAKHLGTEHTELFVTPEQALAVVPELPAMYDEPFADASQVPTALVARLARQSVTVSLSGDGGDELLGGYNRYFLGERLWGAMAPVPARARQWLARGMTMIPARRWNQVYRGAAGALPPKYRLSVPGDKIHKLASVLGVESQEAMYRSLVSHWREPARLVRGATEPETLLSDASRWPTLPTFTQKMMYLDLVTYLADDIFVKVDRASMAVSLEARAPFVDHRLVELAWRVPMRMKVRDGAGKWLMRRILYRHVPRALIERPKMGFGIPIDRWLNGPLRDWAETLLAPDRLRAEGYFDAEMVTRTWREHRTGERNWQYLLWNVLMFQAWKSSSSEPGRA